MFPIRNVKGNVIGFGGRVLDGGEPKYLNSPETPLFSKGSELYGLFEARQAIREPGYALVVEGYMDVVALAQLGFRERGRHARHGVHADPRAEAVAADRHGRVQLRRRLRPAAAPRAARWTRALPHAADNRTIRSCSCRRNTTRTATCASSARTAFGEQVDRAMPLSQFLLNEVLNDKELDQPEGRAKALFDAKPLLQALPANALRVQILHMLADRLDDAVRRRLRRCATSIRARRPSRARPAARASGVA